MGSWAPTPVGLRYYRTNKLKLTYFFMFGLFSITGLFQMQNWENSLFWRKLTRIITLN